MNWLITGGCGFIGTNFIAHLLKKNPNTNIRVLDNLTVGTKKDLSRIISFLEKNLSTLKGKPEGVELVKGDIRDFETCLKCCEAIDIIVHLAASTGVGPSVELPRRDMEVNVIGTFNMLEAARQRVVKKFVFASSGAPLGDVEPPIHEEMASHPVSPYGASKLACEGYCSAYYRAFGIETIALRFGNVYGPGSGHKNSVVAKFIRQAMHGEQIEIYGDGEQTRDFIYVDDLIRAIYLAATRDGIHGETFQIATNSETTVRDLLNGLIPILIDLGFKEVEVRHSKPRVGDIRRNFSDTTKALEKLGWKSDVNLSEGLRRTVEWFMEQENI